MITPTPMPGPRLSADQRRLLAVWKALSASDRDSLLAFAEFLAQRQGGAGTDGDPGPAAPDVAPRQPGESVIAAMRRLSRGYPMLERGDLLNDAAALMAAHTLQGRPADEVIDELEGLFERAYRSYLDGFES